MKRSRHVAVAGPGMDVVTTHQRPNALAPTRPSSNKDWQRAIELTASIERQPSRLLSDIVHGWAEKQPDRVALLSDRETLTYGALSKRINRYARWALANGIHKGDTVALLMPNRPDYLAIWLGITKAGGVVALLNTQLAGSALTHCIRVATAKHLIVASELKTAAVTALAQLDDAPKIWGHGGGTGPRIDAVLDDFSGRPLAEGEAPSVMASDRALLVYTSGTTGLPKAAYVTHRRVLTWSLWFAGLIDATADDRMYDCLPLYHSVGGVVAIGSMLAVGGSVAIVERFSAHRFWNDVVRFDCTVFQYIGELCRYLLNAPSSPNATRHRLRVCCGNGLRGDIWDAFKQRFAIPRILEFYAATEGNFSLFNVEGKPGAIGRIPSFLTHRFPAAIVRFDIEAGAPLRGADGLCIRSQAGEVGEALGRIGELKDGGGRFEGYTSATETEKKVLRDVFAPGDAWFRTGDLMMRDAEGYFYFVDRIGDTFRWKGENVATLEVAEAIAACPGVADISVYGVTVPGHDGRAGMAAIVAGDGFEPQTLHDRLRERLPACAIPLFIRILPALNLTETFKQKKQELVRDGFDPSRVADPLFFRDASASGYVPLDAVTFAKIVSGEARL
jgi:fatty-acyl-CoA synthase